MWHPRERSERHFSTICLRAATLSKPQSKDVPDACKLERRRENNVVLAFLKGHVVLFWLKTTLKKGVMIKERKGGGRSLLCTVCPYPLQKSAVLTVYWATL